MARTRRNADNVLAMPMNESHVETGQMLDSSDEDISRRAYELYCARGREDGHDVDDWVRAERELRGERGAISAA